MERVILEDRRAVYKGRTDDLIERYGKSNAGGGFDRGTVYKTKARTRGS